MKSTATLSSHVCCVPLPWCITLASLLWNSIQRQRQYCLSRALTGQVMVVRTAHEAHRLEGRKQEQAAEQHWVTSQPDKAGKQTTAVAQLLIPTLPRPQSAEGGSLF
jgi:hypothetical protein